MKHFKDLRKVLLQGMTDEEIGQLLADQLTSRRILDKLMKNEFQFDIGHFNQLLRVIAVHYWMRDDFIQAASSAWTAMHSGYDFSNQAAVVIDRYKTEVLKKRREKRRVVSVSKKKTIKKGVGG